MSGLSKELENLSHTFTPKHTSPMASQRNNRPARGSSRNDSAAEEVQLWEQIQGELRQIVDQFNASTEIGRKIKTQDQILKENPGRTTMDATFNQLEELLRSGVKTNDDLVEKIRAVRTNIEILSALSKAKDPSGSSGGKSSQHLNPSSARSSGLGGSSRNASRGATATREAHRSKDKEAKEAKDAKEASSQKDQSSLYDFDGAESPVPSPHGNHTVRKLGSERSAGRDSLPPRGDRDTPSKADSAEPPQLPATGSSVGSSTSASAAALQRSKVVFAKGQDVAFKPKQANNSSNNGDTADWFLGRVAAVLGEGKSRRYKVKDEDPDVSPDERKEYRTSASSMIPIPAAGEKLPSLDKGKIVLALYPDSTTFYKAEVESIDAETGKVSLRFEGEETTGTLQLVERRFVVEYRP
ncbi:hypothetical protein MCOR27_008367 [Pyricularia oryzae]|uniref:SGF29 C-terminal domain-containing protein n=2 Tax=Pyricularia grisea TaxID=148305 RepID=A0ABQ8N2D2_PYRGI|nr:hypothetical protein MCOR01_005412 [Pyricularia oryzae]KAI6290076.1 hypothetical protein MCOR33_011541 [Pyricularia grisea]KAI6253822.1 hypothetical protein MCOR19_009639 [Pyricularia oryzae]KAI6271366.1 hypothetical protein MCOR26_007846 [Pyricularia oryzae]KAI6272396.1 hypothetical protein MCOR27_008367 [Pyricularia oryzae]